jgi:hypothetical protein
LHATGRNPPTEEGLQAEAGFILGEDFHGEPGTMPSELLRELGGQGGWKLCHGFRTFFSWEGRGRFGFARSSPRTKA